MNRDIVFKLFLVVPENEVIEIRYMDSTFLETSVQKNRVLINFEKYSDIFKISLPSIYYLIEKKPIKALLVGVKLLYTKEDIDMYITEREKSIDFSSLYKEREKSIEKTKLSQVREEIENYKVWKYTVREEQKDSEHYKQGILYRPEFSELYKKRIEKYGKKKNFTDPFIEGEMKKRENMVQFNPSVLSEIERGIFKEEKNAFLTFNKLWNDRGNYGAVIASIIYSSHLETTIPMKALMSVWISFKRRILEISKNLKKNPGTTDLPLFVKIYDIIVTEETECHYVGGKNNFLSDLYITGKCNCQCGTYLGYILAKMFPEPNIKVFLYTQIGHIKLLLINSKTGEKYIFETTRVSDYLIRDEREYIDDIMALSCEEQAVGLSVLVNNPSIKKFVQTIVVDMLGIKNPHNKSSAFKSLEEKNFLHNPVDIASFGNYFWILFDWDYYVKNKLGFYDKIIRETNKYLPEVVEGRKWNREELGKVYQIMIEN